MALQTILKAAVQKRLSGTRWAYLPTAFVSAFFALMGWGAEGFSGAALYILLLLLCFTQWVYPTLLVWGLLLFLFSAYAVAVAATPHAGLLTDYVVFFLCGAVPAALLLLGRPKKNHPE
jgi:hypothetical protein